MDRHGVRAHRVDGRLIGAATIAVLAACGGAAAAPPVVNEVSPPVVSREPDERACRAALRADTGDDTFERAQVVVPRAGEALGFCVVTTSTEGRVHFSVSPIVRDGAQWKPTEAATHSEDRYVTADESAAVEMRVEPFPLAPDETGVLFEVTATSASRHRRERVVDLVLIRILPDATTQYVLQLESASIGDETWERVLTRLDSLTLGHHDLSVAVSHHGRNDERWTEIWAWDGEYYQLRETR